MSPVEVELLDQRIKPGDCDGPGELEGDKCENDGIVPKIVGGGGEKRMLYEIEDVPSWYLTLFLGFQHCLLGVTSSLTAPIVLMPAMCMQISTDPDMGNIISTYLFLSGIVTFIQTTFGTRLPIVQGSSFAFMVPALSLLGTERFTCPSNLAELPQANQTQVWQSRMVEVQGGIVMAGLFQIILGACGIFGLIMPLITPITLTCTMSVIGIALFDVGSSLSSSSWPISGATILLVIIFSQYSRSVTVPIPFTKTPERNKLMSYPIFQIFPILLAVVVVWTTCGVLTAMDVLHEGHPGRTDKKLQILQNSDPFRVPYPFQWGFPKFSAGATIGFLSAVIVGIVESLGEYKAVGRVVNAPPPPIHTTNRGVFMEGLGCVLCGIFGTGNGTTSHSGNTGAMSVTRVGSRRVVQVCGVLMILLSTSGKVGGFFASIPDPIVGGILCINFALIIGVGISNLQKVDVTSPRNMFILGLSIYFGLAISKWTQQNRDQIKFGHSEVDFIFQIVLGTGMFIAALISALLDNTIPGTDEERGITSVGSKEALQLNDLEVQKSVGVTYDLPYGMVIIRRYKFLESVPVSPTFAGWNRLPKKELYVLGIVTVALILGYICVLVLL